MPTEITSERDLYEPVIRFLYVSFLTRLREQSAHHSLQLFASNTSQSAGSEGGQWTRPDISALVLGRGQFIPYWKADLHTFEVKTAAGLSETSAHEASAQGRFSNYPWLVFQSVGRASLASDGAARKVTRLAAHLGVGVIHFENPEAPQSWTIELWPRKTGTDTSTTDSFVRERFSFETRERITRTLRSFGWAEDA